MAKNNIKPRKHETGKTINTKTAYGTTSDMIVNDEEILSKVIVSEDCVLAKDERGYYITYKNRVDSGLADPCRHGIVYRENIEKKIDKDLSA